MAAVRKRREVFTPDTGAKEKALCHAKTCFSPFPGGEKPKLLFSGKKGFAQRALRRKFIGLSHYDHYH